MKNFIKIQSTRIRLTTIKKYNPIGELLIGIHYGTSRYKTECEHFKFLTETERDDMLLRLDDKL